MYRRTGRGLLRVRPRHVLLVPQGVKGQRHGAVLGRRVKVALLRHLLGLLRLVRVLQAKQADLLLKVGGGVLNRGLHREDVGEPAAPEREQVELDTYFAHDLKQ